jgi:RNA polymerase sigma factor (sigma-70 family)
MATAPLGTLLRHVQKLAAGRYVQEWTDRQLLDDFAARRNEAAFTALVSRHGPMVLRVCRRVLHHEQDAEDAFQATFLVLARNTGSIRKRDAVADWLHGVAYRTAMQAKRSAARRRNHEARLRDVLPQRAASPTWDDVQAVLDEEVQRLPPCFRGAFVLCVLEGKGGSEAADELGCKEGTVKSRVNRARRLLQRQLARRGIKLSALLAALSVAASAGRAALPATLARATVRSGLLVAAGEPAAAVIPPHVATLAAGVTRAMSLTKAKIATALLLAVGLIAASAGALAHQALATKEPPPGSQQPEVGTQKAGPAAAKRAAADEKADGIEVSGRVVDPDGKPFAGAKVFFARSVLAFRDTPPPPPTATSDAQGRFRLRVPRAGYQTDHEKGHWLQGAVVAVGQGFAPGWAGGDNAEKLADVTIKLTRDVPVEGRVVDLQGRPVAGVKVQVLSVKVREDGGDLKAFVADLQSRMYADGQILPGFAGTMLDPALLGLTRSAVTGADGTFRLTGISGECLVGLRFAGPTIETAEVYTLTRPAPTIRLPRHLVFYGAVFDHAAAPTRPIEGVVRDKDTGKPLAGVTIQALLPSALRHRDQDRYLRTTTDLKGRYRLVGLPREEKHLERWERLLQALPAPGQPYLPAVKTRRTEPGLGPVTVDFSLKRGVLIRGRVTDKATGRPVAAVVRYGAFVDNPHLKEAPGFRNSDHDTVRTAEDGSFTLVGLPGRGLLAAKPADREEEGRYVMGAGADEIQGPRFGADRFNTEPSAIDPYQFNVLTAINPAQDAEPIVRDLVLDPGRTVTVTMVDPDGRPVKGASIDGVRGVWLHRKDLPTAEFRLTGVDPKHPRWYFVRHRGRNLGTVVLLKGDEPTPVTVRLQKCGIITGRVVDEDGLPRPAWIMSLLQTEELKGKDYFGVGGTDLERTGKDGRFRIEGVIPGHKVGVYAGKNPSYFDPLVTGLTLKPGEMKDLGDVKAKPSQ